MIFDGFLAANERSDLFIASTCYEKQQVNEIFIFLNGAMLTTPDSRLSLRYHDSAAA